MTASITSPTRRLQFCIPCNRVHHNGAGCQRDQENDTTQK